jgi:flagellar biosynthesis protein FlhA
MAISNSSANPSNNMYFSWEAATQRTDIMFALGLVLIMTILIMPMPRILMDLCLAFSLAFSVMIFMTSLFISKPLEFSSFPTVLLVSTMIRLALNVASTRLILTHGHEGPGAAGNVIEAFGQFVMEGNFVIGIIVFAILVIVNFVVITKGSGRIAEVSARFTLDAMPGKQMAIDADLSSGLLTEDEARKRRKEIESESNFFGSMDGAAKFVRGDAIAGLLITFINIIGGVIIGVAQKGMDIGNATHAYTLLTVGDGLISQIPALIVSTAAGLLVSKSGIDGSTDKALFGQLSAHPAALGMCSFLMGALALLPGIPMLPFLALAGATGIAAWFMSERQKNEINEAKVLEEINKTAPEASNKNVPLDNTSVPPSVDTIRLELGYALLGLVSKDHGGTLPDQIRNLRIRYGQELGFVIPTIRLQDNLQLEGEEYVILIKETEAGRGTLRAGKLLAMDPQGGTVDLPGEQTKDPSFGIPATWVAPEYEPEANARGYTLVDPEIVLTTHMVEIIKDNVSELMTYGDVLKMLDNLPESYKKLLNDIVPSQISVGTIQRILQTLIGERVSIRDLTTILEGIAEASAFSRNLTNITEYVRTKLSRQITHNHLDENGVLPILTLSPQWEQEIINSLVGDSENRQLAMAPSTMQDFINRIKSVYEEMSFKGETPVLVTSALVRPFVRSILERSRSSTVIMAQTEVHAKARLRNLGQV